MSKGKWWSADEDEAILQMRDRDGLGWKAIADRVPGRTAAACEQRYYGKLKGARDLTPRRTGPKPSGAAVGYWRRPVIVSVPLAAKPAPAPFVPRGRVLGTDALREHAALCARIETCGDLTRGFFGDPPPGRSALDERSRAAAEAAQRRSSEAADA